MQIPILCALVACLLLIASIHRLQLDLASRHRFYGDILAQNQAKLLLQSLKSYFEFVLAFLIAYFLKYINSYDINDFIRLIKFFDNSLFKMIEDFTPARTTLTSGVVIKQNLLERNRYAPPSASFTDEGFNVNL